MQEGRQTEETNKEVEDNKMKERKISQTANNEFSQRMIGRTVKVHGVRMNLRNAIG